MKNQLESLIDKIEAGGAASVEELRLNISDINKRTLSNFYLLSRIYGVPNKSSLLDQLVSRLEQARNQISMGDLKTALNSLESDVSIPAQLEKLRVHYFNGDWQLAIETAQALVNQELAPGDLALAFQVWGAALIETPQMESAIEKLLIADEIYDSINGTLGLYLTTVLLARAYAFLDNTNNSHALLERALRLLQHEKFGIKNWLAYFRAGMIAFNDNPEKQRACALGSLWIAQIMDDEFHRSLTQLEIDVCNKKKTEVIQSLSIRHEALLKRQNSFTCATWWNTKSNPINIISDQALLPEAIIFKESGVVILCHEKQMFWLPPESPRLRILCELSNARGKIEKATLFEKIWGISWNKNRHSNLINVTIKGIRDVMPNFILSQDSSVCLMRETRILAI